MIANRKMFKMLFTRKKIKTEIHEAENGQIALDMVLPNMDFYQIIVMDNLMPIMVILFYFSFYIKFFKSM